MKKARIDFGVRFDDNTTPEHGTVVFVEGELENPKILGERMFAELLRLSTTAAAREKRQLPQSV